MKKLFIIILIFFFKFGYSQTEKAKIQNDFESMIEFTHKNQIDKIIEMTYPRFV